MLGNHSGFGNLSAKFPNLTSNLYGYTFENYQGYITGSGNNQSSSRLGEGRLGIVGNTMYGHLNGIVTVNPGGGGQFPSMWYNGSLMNNDQMPQNVGGAGSYASTSAVGTSINFFDSVGNISGTFILYKITV